MGRPIALLVFAALLATAVPSAAGNNFGGTAALSWSPIAEVCDRSSIPLAPVPLYLILDGVPDLRALAVNIKWLPNDLVGPCYILVPADSVTSGCGSTAYLQPPGVFDGDSSYTWQIMFDGPAHGCVQYTVAGERCEGKPASFCLISVKTMDSDDAIDELSVLGGATILGGVAEGCPVVAEDVFPHVAVIGRENTFTIQGRDLTSDTRVVLVDDGAMALASSVQVEGDTTATATVAVPNTFSGKVDVVVTTSTSSDTLAQRVIVADSTAGLAPVWELDVSQAQGVPRASVIANEFTNPAYIPTFPVAALPIKHRTEIPSTSGDHSVPVLTVDIAPLDLDANGRPSVAGLSFVATSSISVDPWDGRLTVLSPTAPSVSLPAVPSPLAARSVKLDVRSSDTDPFVGWRRSPDNRWAVARHEHSVQVFSGSSSSLSQNVAGRAYEGVFSLNGQRYATVVEDPRGIRWIVISPTEVLREGLPGVDAISQLALSPDGTVLTFNRQRDAREPSVTVGVDLATGQERMLASVPDGTRYYSGDGKTMAALQPSPGRLQLFDVTDPLNPTEIATPFEAPDGHFITAAVSGDGMLVALQLLESENNPHRTLSRVIALDRNLRQRALVIASTPLAGLQFQGRYLLVGTQRHPIPSYFIFNPTTQIKLYDLGSL